MYTEFTSDLRLSCFLVKIWITSIEYKGPVEQANNYKNTVIIIRTFILFTCFKYAGLTVQSVPLRDLVEQSVFRELLTSISSTQA